MTARPPKRIPTIRSRLALLAVACVIPASFMVAVLITRSYGEHRARFERDSTATARALMSAVDRELAGMQAALLSLATSPHLKAGDLSAFDSQAREALRNLPAINIVLIDAGFQQRVNTLRPFGTPLPSEPNPPTRRLFEQGGTMVTNMFVGPVAGKPLIAVAIPVYRGNKVAYVMGASLFAENLSDILTQQKLPAGWIAAILDSSGRIVARTHAAETFVGKMGSKGLLEHMRAAEEGALENVTVDGKSVLAVFSKSRVSSWTVAIGIPIAQVTADLHRSLWWLLGATAALLLGSFALAWRIGGQIAASVHALTEPALALALGQEVSVPGLALKETDEVAGALTEASRNLRDSRHRANHDALTGLANRALLNEIVDHQLALCQRTGGALTVLYIDLDGFKAVNDTHGHAVGDELLRAVAGRLKDAIRTSDVAARLGGDEFAILLVDTGAQAASAVARKLAERVGVPYPIGEVTISISASVGMAGYPESGTSSEALLRSADEGMYRAKPARRPG